MKIAVPVKFVPDLVEELAIAPGGCALDTTWLRLIINEFDDHAVEQAILLKERGGGHVTVMTIESEGADDFLFTASAKGADQLFKLTGDFANVNNHALARAYADLLKETHPDLVLTGVQAHNDIDGSVDHFRLFYAVELDCKFAIEITLPPLFANPCELWFNGQGRSGKNAS